MSDLDLHLILAPGRGKRVALEESLREAIREGRLTARQPLPSTRTLAAELRLARGTVVEAYSQLVAEGYLRTRPGGHTSVAPGVSSAPVASATEVVRPQPKFDFRFGRPDLSAFPRQVWLRSLRRGLESAPDHLLGPGDLQGSEKLRIALVAYLGRVRGVRAEPESIVICSGYIQGLRLIFEVLALQGHSSVAFEDPCHPEHRAAALAACLKVKAVPVDDEGARTDQLPDADAVVLTPAHQCPLGSTLSPERRDAVLRWAAEGERIIIEDDYDAEFRFDRQPVGSLQGRDPERVIFGGTTSKTLAPALRLAWLVLPQRLLEPIMEAKRRMDNGTGILEQLAMAEMIDSGAYDLHVRRMRRRYARRREQLLALAAASAPEVNVVGTAAGLHAVALLPEGLTERMVKDLAVERSVALTSLGPFWHEPGGHPQGIVAGYATPPEHAFAQALRQLDEVVQTFAVRVRQG